VHGSFVVTRAGALAGKDMPPLFDGTRCSRVGRRVVRLHEGSPRAVQELDPLVMRFADQQLYLPQRPKRFLLRAVTNASTPRPQMALPEPRAESIP